MFLAITPILMKLPIQLRIWVVLLVNEYLLRVVTNGQYLIPPYL